ncbi:hypothetical protein PRZ48_005695 [Zasmidium cellare]|uniref:Tachykinin family protein n=1 Tax=Zasmidium cellare TaxID=395010 RepID=A0ABR0ELZ2_ZASCE|nr:hypothetical protein PRZ48_005695 [Zasmidium cellare]
MTSSQDAEARDGTPKHAPLLFVDVGTSGKQRSKQSRAHVARVNRQRQREERLKSEGAKRGQSASDARTLPEATAKGTKTRTPQDSDSRLSIRRRDDKARPTATSRRWHSAPTVTVLSRTPFPVFGALRIGSFDLEKSHGAADIADYCFNTVMNSWLDPELKPVWFAAFFEHPLVFHSLSYSCGILQDVSNGRSIQPARLVHRLKTIQIVNQQLGNIENVDPEPILLAITTLWRINTDQLTLKQSLEPLSEDVEGRGFVTQVPGALPTDALATLRRLSMVDKLLDDFSAKIVSLSDDIILATLGNSVQHELLSLLPWQSLSEDDRRGCYLVTYEVCRITAILYSNAVIFPMAPNASWLEKLLKQLRLVLETSNVSIWHGDTLQILIWSLFIAGMAAFWTRHRNFFVAHLRSTLKQAGLTSLEAVKAMIREFLWRDDGCGQGATILWDIVHPKENTD